MAAIAQGENFFNKRGSQKGENVKREGGGHIDQGGKRAQTAEFEKRKWTGKKKNRWDKGEPSVNLKGNNSEEGGLAVTQDSKNDL